MNVKQIQPYLFFGGRCQEAVEFYRTAMGAQVDFTMLYKDSPQPMPAGKLPTGWENKVMHTSFRIGGSTVMASDGCEASPKFEGFSLSINAANEDDARKIFGALSAGGQGTMPLTKTFWSPCFGMLTDRFGVAWMITVETK